MRSADGRAVANAVLTLGDRTLEVRSDDTGRFSLGWVARGAVVVSARIVGYAAAQRTVTLQGDSLDIDLTLEVLGTATRLPEVPIRAPESSGIPGFDDRRASGFGRFISRQKLDSMPGSHLSEALRRLGTQLRFVRHCQGGTALASTTSGGVSLSQRPHRDPIGTCKMPDECYAQVFFDGIRIYSMSIPGLPPRLDTYPLNSLEAIEYYRGGSEVPLQFGGTGAGCGTLLLWSRRS